LAAAALIVAPLTTAAAADTVITSIDFEDGTPGTWTQSGGGENTLSFPEVDGSRVLQVTDRDADYVGIESPLGVFEPGTTYSVSARIKLAEGTPATQARFVMKPAYTWAGNAPVTADAWTTLTGQYAIPAGTDVSAFQLYIGTGDLAPAAPYTYYLDDITVTAVDATDPVDPTDPGIPPVTGPTALSNDFEEGLGGWGPRDSGSGAPTVALTAEDPQQGTQAAALTGRTSQGSGFGHPIAGLQADTTYKVTAWVRFGAGQPAAPVWLSLQRDYQGATTFSTLAQFADVTNSGWTQVRASFPLAAFDSGLLYFETDYNGTNTSDLYFDDIQVSVPEPAEIQDITPIKDTLDVPVGVAIDSRETTGVAAELLLRHFDQITGENYMKPEAWYDANGQFRPNPEAVALMDFAEANDLSVYGHVLVWHSQTPAFFFQAADGTPLTTSEGDKQILRDRLREHVFNVAEWLATEYGEFGGGNPPTRGMSSTRSSPTGRSSPTAYAAASGTGSSGRSSSTWRSSTRTRRSTTSTPPTAATGP
jgi:endo-1,4-beta-xylanase